MGGVDLSVSRCEVAGEMVLTDQTLDFTRFDRQLMDFTRFDRQLIMSKTEWRKRYEGNEISGRI